MAKKRRKPSDERKEACLKIRLTERQKAEIEEAARGDSLDVSSWFRLLAAERMRGVPRKPG